MMDKTELINRIALAFQGIEKPSKEAVTRGDSLEAAVIRNYFTQRSWENVDVDFLENFNSRADLSAVVTFFDKEGFCYYLPSIFCFLIEHGEKYGGIVDSLLWKLASNDYISSPKNFTSAQRVAIREFILHAKYLSHDDYRIEDVSKALVVWAD